MQHSIAAAPTAGIDAGPSRSNCYRALLVHLADARINGGGDGGGCGTTVIGPVDVEIDHSWAIVGR